MTAAKTCVCLIAVLLISACDSSTGIAGIDGTGAPRVADNALAYGLVTATDSYFAVNGVRYDTSAAKVLIDGQPGRTADVALGDVARVAAKTDPSNPALIVAENVIVDDAVEGPIAVLDSSTSTLVALGQTIRVTPTTLFDASVLPQSLDGLAVGQTIEVAGFRASNGDIFASRIERKAAGNTFETTGSVANHHPAARQFLINGLVVSYAAAPSGAATVRNGEIVEVRGSSLLPGGVLVATHVERAAPVSGGPGDRVDIEGFVTTFDGQMPETFDVAGVPARTTSATVVEDVQLALDAKVAVKGTIDSSGTVVAADLRRGGYPGPTSGPYTIVGQVFDAHSGGVPGAGMNIWVQQARGGYSYVWANGRLATNSAGEFIAPNFPDATLSFWAVKPGFVQPCVVNAVVPPSGVVQIELVADATLAVLDPPRPLVVRGTVLTGTVFETVNGVRQPVVGAGVEANTEYEVVIATTKTDLQGRFFLCNVPKGVLLYVGGTGFVLRDLWLPDSTTVSPLEIELQRR